MGKQMKQYMVAMLMFLFGAYIASLLPVFLIYPFGLAWFIVGHFTTEYLSK